MEIGDLALVREKSAAVREHPRRVQPWVMSACPRIYCLIKRSFFLGFRDRKPAMSAMTKLHVDVRGLMTETLRFAAILVLLTSGPFCRCAPFVVSAADG